MAHFFVILIIESPTPKRWASCSAFPGIWDRRWTTFICASAHLVVNSHRMESDCSHSWRYGRRPYPAPDGIRLSLNFVGGGDHVTEHDGRVFYKLTEGHFCVIDPANGGHSVAQIERGLLRRIEISAI